MIENIANTSYLEIKGYLNKITKQKELEDVLAVLSLDKRATVLKLVSKYRNILEKKKAEEERLINLWQIEEDLFKKNYCLIAGIDEAGRGPLAGPVVASAVILPPRILLPGLDDSKKIKPGERLQLAIRIKEIAICWAIGVVDASTIDKINILQATNYAMELALKSLKVKPEYVLVDGTNRLNNPVAQKAIINGDSLSASIAAASIVAKVHRDKLMETYDELYPNYGFIQHKGYGTKEHLISLKEYGPSPVHRKTFQPVAQTIFISP